MIAIKRFLPMTLLLAAVLALAALTLTALPSGAAPLPATADDAGGDEDPGRQVFEDQKCNLCHAVSSAGIEAKTKSEKLKGPDLVNVGKRIDNATLIAFLLKEKEIEGREHKKEFKGSDEELHTLVDWLLEQKSSE